MEQHDNHDNCKCVSSSCKQTIEDMDFERGIWYAAQHGDYDRVKKLIIRGVDVEDNAGYTALHYAARNGHTKVCELLINFGASLDAQTRAGLATPLHRSASAGKFDIVKLLVASGANVSLKDADGQTCLHRAVAQGHMVVAKYLVSINNKLLSESDNHGRLPKDLTNTSIDENNSFLFSA